MRLNVKALAISGAILWGGSIFLVGICQMVWPGYGLALLELAGSIYPGYAPGGLGATIVGTLYAMLDGAVGGAVLAWLYNRVTRLPVAAP